MKVLLLLALAAPALAQTAKVIALPADLADQAVALRRERAALDLKEETLRNNIQARLLRSPSDHSRGLYGWEAGFEYSDDFKFIVPKQPLISAPHNLAGCLNPAIGALENNDGSTTYGPVTAVSQCLDEAGGAVAGWCSAINYSQIPKAAQPH